MNMTQTAKREIERYLRHVHHTLRSREVAECQEIVDELRTHILESLTAQGLETIRAGDVRHVLATMDPPQAYRSDDEGTGPSRRSRADGIGRIGFSFLLAAVGCAGAALLLGTLFLSAPLLRGGLILAALFGVAALGLGIASWRSPLGKVAAISSLLMMVAALCFAPLGGVRSGPGEPDITQQEHADARGEPTEAHGDQR